MGRIGGVVVVRLVAAPAVARCICVVVIDVAQTALIVGQHGGVIAGQRQGRRGMAESGSCPAGGGVARGTILREPGGGMGRIGGAVVIGLVAIPASPAGQAVIIVSMTL